MYYLRVPQHVSVVVTHQVGSVGAGVTALVVGVDDEVQTHQLIELPRVIAWQAMHTPWEKSEMWCHTLGLLRSLDR